MKKLLNEKTSFVSDMLKGISVLGDHEVINDTVIVRKEKKHTQVALVSGGGSGHEPAHAGYVAQGMIDAAVCGEVFTSPTPDKILDAIKAVATEAGVLLIVKNYAGDVMNFEMAMDMAAMEEIKVDMIVVADDIAIDNKEQRRGVAGTIFVHKYAGYLSEQGKSLEEIKEKLTALLENMSTIGMAIEPCMVPTTGQYGFELAEDEMEIGIGIHGEKGMYREKIETLDKIIDKLMKELRKERTEDKWIIMINGMGGTPLSELYVVNKYLNEYLDANKLVYTKLYTGNYMTALDMQGFSITLVKHEDEQLKAFEAPTESVYFH